MQQVDEHKSDPVTFRFRNIGPVKHAELDLGDLTIIAGRNNTGKTYLVYTLYGFLKMWDDVPPGYVLHHETEPEAKFPDWTQVAKQLVESGHYTIPLNNQSLGQQRKWVIRLLTQYFSEHTLSEVFSSQPEKFERSSMEIVCNYKKLKPPRSFKVVIVKGLSFSFKSRQMEVVVSMDEIKSQPPPESLAFYVAHHYVLFLLKDLFPDPFILSAERFGISLFYRELDFTKNQLVDLLQKMGDDKRQHRLSPYLVIDRATSRYALPIKDNIDYTRSIPERRERNSEIYKHKLFDDIKEMMDGYYSAAGDDIRFISKARGKGRSFNIPLHLASSSARGLSDFYFFLRHVAKNNHLVIIDEPESHLDTDNQIQLARLLVRFVRAGLKVLITTHSDYVIKEINNLVMLSRPFADKDAVVRKLKYGSADALDPESIRAYVAEQNGLTRCTVDRFGIDMPVFDTTIDQINRVSNELASRLAEDTEA